MVQRRSEAAADVQLLLEAIRRAYRRATTIWLWLDEASAHTAVRTQALAAQLSMKLVWLPKQWPAWNAMDPLWRELKRLVAANRQPETIDSLSAG